MQVVPVEQKTYKNTPSKEADAMIEWILCIDACRAENKRW